MKPKPQFQYRQLVIISMPFLFLSLASQAQNPDKNKIADEALAAKEAKEETAERVKKSAEKAEDRVKEASERTKDKADRAIERTKEAADREKEKAERAIERAKEDAEREQKKAEQEKAVAAKKAAAAEKTPAVTPHPPANKPTLPPEPRKPRNDKSPRGDRPAPVKDDTTKLIPLEPAKQPVVEIQVTEPERLAETKVTEVTREVQRDLDQRKTRIGGRTEAQALVNDILGSESRISQAEINRQERFRPRFENQRSDEGRRYETSPDQRRAATTYYQERLRGREVEGPPPEFFRHSRHRNNWGNSRYDDRVEYVRPRYLNNGRRYVHYDSRASIPAILMAALAMNQVRFQPTREIAPMFYDDRDSSYSQNMHLPPENYRSDDSWVVSYPVDEKSMISSEDILFLQGTTQFSDPYSYEVIGVMADAMKAMPDEERFVVEGHASAEGSYESNMILSQQRAEYIVREIVRQGVSPYRLLPVGYGESEARRAEDSDESLRSQDRRVVVFRMKSEAVAQR